MNRIRLRPVFTCIVGAFACAVALLPATAAASSLLRTVESQPCAGTAAQTWRFGYRLYFVDSTGHTTDRAGIPGIESQAQRFTDAVATDSGCALRASIDIYDMEAEPWTGTAQPLNFTPPTDNQAFRAAGGYDATLIRYPKQGIEEYSGITGTEGASGGSGATTAFYPVSAFPVDSAGRSYPSDPPEDPWRLLLMHEWMHQVVSFYVPAELGWPHNDVHGAFEHGYTNTLEGSGVVEPYFADMLQGKVFENGQPKGLLAQDYLVEGTPAHPKRKFLTVRVDEDAKHHIHYSAPTDFDGTLTFTVREGWGSPNPNPVVREGGISAPAGVWTLDDRNLPAQVTVCASTGAAGTAAYRPYNECFETLIPRCVVPRLTGMRVGRVRQRLERASCRLGPVRHLHGRGRSRGPARVRAQSIKPGRHLKPRSGIRIVVAPRRSP